MGLLRRILANGIFLLWRFFEISSGFVRDASKKVLLLLRQK